MRTVGNETFVEGRYVVQAFVKDYDCFYGVANLSYDPSNLAEAIAACKLMEANWSHGYETYVVRDTEDNHKVVYPEVETTK